MSENNLFYSIQRTYILTHVLTPEKDIITCDERIDIPTIEPLSNVKPFSYDTPPLTVIPCIELAGAFLSEFNLTFETNENLTVLPIKIDPVQEGPFENPYTYFRYVLVLPRGATGVKSCKLIHKATGKEVQHNLTFGIMPPPYNYDNMLFGYLTGICIGAAATYEHLMLTSKTDTIVPIELPKGEGKQPIRILRGELFCYALFEYPLSPESTIHKPKITLYSDRGEQVYTLSLNKTRNGVSIDLLTGMITAYDIDNGEITQQFMIDNRYGDFRSLAFENFDDIVSPTLRVEPRGARVE